MCIAGCRLVCWVFGVRWMAMIKYMKCDDTLRLSRPYNRDIH
jgi:hypothetical protein